MNEWREAEKGTEGGGNRQGGCVLAGSRALRWDVVSPALRRETPVVRDSSPVWFC